jgi:hypothetical protein
MTNQIEGAVSKESRLTRLDFIVGILGAVILIVFWLVVATFPSFFFFNPIGDGNKLRRVELVFSTIGWILTSTIAPFLLFLYAAGKRKALKYLPFTAIIYPFSLVVSQITIYAETGKTYISYLTNFPIFFFTDILLPILILFIWHDLKLKSD